TVLNQGDAGVNLCAYVVAHGNAERTDIKKYLADHLPNYMVPSFFVYLDRLPLTANGKIDRKALPQPELQMEEYKAPSSQTEQTLASIWSEILGVEKISATASFFDLGGHSLKAISVVSAIRKELGVEISLQELFQKPILKELATVIDGSAKKEFVRIPRAKEAAWYPVSFAQRRMMILNEMEGIHTTYNMPMALQLEGNVDVVKMGEVFRGLIERHEAFRTTFRYEEGEPVQTIHPEAHFEIEYLTGDQLEVVFSGFVRPFNLAIAPLLRVGVMQEASGKQLLLIDMHHIISDGVSMNLLAEEFDRLYNGEKLPALKIQYKDYAVWQQDEAGSEHYQAQEAYWMERLSGDLPILELPTDYPRPQVQSFEGAAVSMQIDSELSRRINKLAVKHGATQYMVMLAALNVLLSKYTGQEDIIIGTSVAGRTHSDLSGVMGMFVNSLAMRNQPVGSKTFQEFLEEIKEESLAAFDNQDYPYEALVEKLNVRRDSSRNPIFDVMLNVQNIESSKAQKSGKHGTIIDSKKVNAKFDLKFEIGENDRRISVHVDYATKIYTENTINSLIKHFLKILEEVSDNDQVELCAIEILTDREKNKILYTFNQTNVDFPFEKTVHGFFEEQVKKTPDQIAVICSGEKLTYVELNRKANQLAAVLRNESVLPDQVVGIMTERSMEMIIGILAILKAGGAYLPLDPYAPLERIQYMLEDSKAEILLVQNGALVKGNFNGKTIFLDTEYEEKNVKDTQITSKPNNLAYVIYTSGSTGKPKGVMIEHSSVINRINWMLNKYPLHSNDIILQKTPYTFDVSVWELFMWFFNGNTLCFLAPDAEKDPMKIIETVSSEKVSVIHFVPSMFNLFLEYLDSHKIKGLLSSLKYIFTSGEALSVYTVEKFNDCSNGDFTATLHNLYGPTEATVDVSYYDCASTQSLQTIPIGKPIHNTQLYILNQYQQPVPIGVLGELYISGAGVARGYLNLPELTNERFLPNPFLSQGRMYKTGDLAKWMPNGDIEYAGRVDDQVKIRGYRIELGEIANTVRKINGILEVAIHTISHCGELKICAYVVAQKEMNTQEIKNYLANHLPNYMVPSFFVYLNRLPLTANGKIDRKALPKPDLQIEEAYRSPSSETEQTLAHIWSEILGVEGISATASFFDLGGHSLKAIRMVSAIRKELGVAVSLQELFQKPILEELAATIDGSTKTEYVQIPRAMEAAWYPVSFAQKRMMILNEMEGIQAAYNMPSVLQLQGNIDMLRMEEVFLQLIQRHEAFRTSLNYEKGEPVQVIHSEVPFSIETLVGDQVDAMLREFVRPFNLASAPLLRIGFMTEATGKSLLFIDMHHIISDGISMNLLAEEFDRLYSGIELPALEIQYKDYAVWQHEEAGSKEYQAQEAYWLEQFSDELPILELPTDFPRPQVQSFEGSAVSVQIEPELSVRINELAAKHSATQYMVILAALNVLLAKYTGQEDIVIGTPVAGRTHLEMKNILGLFVNTVAIRSQPQRSKTFQSFLMEIKKNSLNAFHNQSYPYEALVEKLNVPRDPSRNPIFDVLLNVQNMETNSTEPQGVHYSFYPTELNVSKFDMKILVSEAREGLKLHIEYASKLFSEKTIENLAKHLITILDVVVKNEDVRLSEIEMLSPDEREQLLYSFNDTVAAYPQDKTIHELFEVQVEQSPTQVAVRGGDDQLTYQELQHRANILASLLRDRGVKPGDQVAILLEPSVEIAVSILGILKAGSSYVPLDPETPEERLQYQLKDSDAQYVVTVRKTMKPGLGESTCLYLDDIDWSKQVLHLEETGQDPEQAAYVIYTSGTTGKPKGVEVTHRNVVNYVSAFIQS
ncbi:non-ribosomal peptide synthetase, partial [Paenibacillus sp. OK060]|uniref:non-ribosomal peptide synthetase n=1 Tax=Paenibacillus sp. OK060 TaxID=1881034 RepID=UPI00115FDAB6